MSAARTKRRGWHGSRRVPSAAATKHQYALFGKETNRLLPAPRLLDVCHIIADGDDEFGAPVIPNGLALSKVHHAAFDGHLIGIDPDYRVHVSERLLDLHDGPILELGIKKMDGKKIWTPRDTGRKPDRDRLAMRFEEFKGHAA